MQKTPLGMDEELWKRRHEFTKSQCKKDKYFKKGYESGKAGETRENPYTLSSDVWELLRKRTRWFLGYEEGWHAGKERRNRKHKHKRRETHEQIDHIKKLAKPKKHKHGHKHKHRKH